MKNSVNLHNSPRAYKRGWTWYVQHATCGHLNGVLSKFLSSVVPTLQPLKFLYQIFNLKLKENRQLVLQEYLVSIVDVVIGL
jgi:hypothetical protein